MEHTNLDVELFAYLCVETIGLHVAFCVFKELSSKFGL